MQKQTPRKKKKKETSNENCEASRLDAIKRSPSLIYYWKRNNPPLNSHYPWDEKLAGSENVVKKIYVEKIFYYKTREEFEIHKIQ